MLGPPLSNTPPHRKSQTALLPASHWHLAAWRHSSLEDSPTRHLRSAASVSLLPPGKTCCQSAQTLPLILDTHRRVCSQVQIWSTQIPSILSYNSKAIQIKATPDSIAHQPISKLVPVHWPRTPLMTERQIPLRKDLVNYTKELWYCFLPFLLCFFGGMYGLSLG